ncbi:MAG TPA: J domain-containing protein [Oculatellaceae cyanobacterium]
MKDYYKILEIQPDASLEVLTNAYRALVRKYHPDLYHTRLKGPMNARMQELNEAYETLNNPIRRAEYDKRYQAALQEQNTRKLQPIRWKVLLLWALGTFLLLKILLKPLLFSPWGRLILLGAFCCLLFRLLSLTKQKR